MTKKISELPVAGSVVGTEILPIVQSSTTKSATLAQIAALAAVKSVNTFTGIVALTTNDIPENTNLYYTATRFNTAFAAKTTGDLTEGANLYYTQTRFDTAFAAKSTTNLSEGTNQYFTTVRARTSLSATSPIFYNTSTGVISSQQANASQAGYLSAADWSTFNNKLDSSRFNYITNPDAELNVTGWNLYNDAGRTVPAFVVIQDLTFTAVASGGTGNGINIDYIFHATQPSSTPLVTVVSGTHITVAWYNGPTLANNPTATQLKAAFDAVSGATAIATCAISGTAGNRQYETGSHLLASGGDTSPVDGTGGSVDPAITFTRNTSTPLVGNASFDFFKDANSRIGTGVSTDFIINSLDKGNPLQISFAYSGSSGMVLGSASDVRVFIYDTTNAVMIPCSISTIAGPVSTAKTFVCTFTASSTSVNYRLILHIATTNATSWDLLLDSVTVNDVVTAGAATQVPMVALLNQPINGSVTDRMAVVWNDGATAWIPAVEAAADYWGMYGFAINLVGLTASIVVKGSLSGFSFGPFAGYNQYVDVANPGLLTPIYSGATTYVIMGKAISADTINVQPYVPYLFNVVTKGSLLTGNNTTDAYLAAGSNGQVPFYNSANANGFAVGAAVVAAAPFTYTTATRTLTIATATTSVTGVLSSTDWTTFNGKANLASPTFTGTPTLPTGTIATTQTAADSSTKVATTAFVTTADNLKAPLASPTFTGDVNASTGNVLISTIGKGLSVKTGTNAKIGTAVLVAGTVTVANTSVTANSRIFLTSNVDGGTVGAVRVSAKVVGTSFTITSLSAIDTSTIAWYIVESIP